MSNHPDFTSHGYQVSRELGRNREAGRITYLAKRSPLAPLDKEGEFVVIKEFRFAISGADWSGFKAYQREIEILQQLNHPRIPRYLDSFETSSGFCLVQEYKTAPSLAEQRSFTPEEIKQIAVSVLEILVYLQQRTPPVIHRDIKPENILVDKQLNAYLIDFGFARIRGGEMALSSVAAGTVGFMPPEEQFGRSLTEASDLYSLGATLICLLTGTRSVDVGKLIDDNYRFEFKKLVSKINPRFVEWLLKMVEPNLKNRYTNAAVALAALKPIDVVASATWLETLGRAIKLRRKVPLVGLATLGVFAVIATKSIIFPTQTFKRIANPPAIPKQIAVGEYSANEDAVGEDAADEDALKQLLQTKKCERCNLQNAKLAGANLVGANLAGANLAGANLMRANLTVANLAGANLADARLMRANLTVAKLMDANLAGAKLMGANLVKVNLTNAHLLGADLGGVNLEKANLAGANLDSANLRGANLRSTNLEAAQNVVNATKFGSIRPDGGISKDD
jgi:Protein kinase domain/Pentapeptide repeats (8 copies)